jgi:hypothetical protein
MFNIKLYCSLFAAVFLFSCVGRQAIYTSPFNGISSPYRTTPLHSDSVKSASYFNGGISFGGANDRDADSKFSLSADLSRSHNFGNFQAHYGGGLTAGSYGMKRYDSFDVNSTVDHEYLNARSKAYFFGGANFDGGINLVKSTDNGEFRILGLETSLHHEFGNYLKLREEMPDSVATVVIRDKFFGTAGLYTEFVVRANRSLWGGKFGYGTVIGSKYHHFDFADSYFIARTLNYRYFNICFQLTQDKWTLYSQINLAEKGHSMLFGFNYRIGASSKL